MAVVERHAEADAAALELVRATVAARGCGTVRTRDLLPAEASRSEKTLLAHSLYRLVLRGSLEEVSASYSQPNEWKLANGGQ